MNIWNLYSFMNYVGTKLLELLFVFNHSFGTVRTCCAYGLNGLTLNDWLNIMMRDKK